VQRTHEEKISVQKSDPFICSQELPHKSQALRNKALMISRRHACWKVQFQQIKTFSNGDLN